MMAGASEALSPQMTWLEALATTMMRSSRIASTHLRSSKDGEYSTSSIPPPPS